MAGLGQEEGDAPVLWQQSSGYIDRLEVREVHEAAGCSDREGLAQGCTPRLHTRPKVNNFKSYRGRQDIGPFKSFTAVVGPNGSGKSNLMDAISFVLGVRTAQLRGSLKELLYQNSEGTTEEDRPRRGFVKLVYRTDEEEQVSFARHILPSSSDPDSACKSDYKINDKTVTWEAYSQKLGSFGILVKVRNFLVFQGDIEAVAAKTPQGLTTLFEQISGSDAYKQQYDELNKSTAKADEKVSAAFSRKKAVAAERKQKKDQKDEAERYLAKQEELRALHMEHLLFTLYHLKADRDAATREHAQLKAQHAKVTEDHKTYDDQLDAIKKRAATHAKEKMLHEKKIKKLQGDKDKKTPDLMKAKETFTRLAKSLATQEKEVAEMESKANAAAAKVTTLEKELKAVHKARTKLEAEAQAHYAKYASGAGAGLESASLQQEYQDMKAQVVEKTAKLETEKETLAAQLKAESDALRHLLARQAAFQARADTCKQQAEEAQARSTEAAKEAAAAKQEAKTKRAEKTKCDDALRQNTSQKDFLERELNKVLGQLQESRSHRSEANKEKAMTEAVEALKRLYTNRVYGRLTDLGKVSRRDYHLALSVAMGRNIDSVIVDSERTARECIQYLKDHRVPPMTFVPLNSVKVHPVNERLRSGLGGTAKLALDLVEPETPELVRAFQYAFDNTIVCDTVEEARALAYGGAERHKVVSKDGTQFNRAGLITGGDAGSLGTKAARWDDKMLTQLKTQQQDLQGRLQALPVYNTLREQAAGLAQALSDLEARIQYKEAEAKTAKERSAQASESAAVAERSAQELQRDVDAKQALVDKHTRELQVLTKRIDEVADRLFAPFSSRLGVKSIREYEETHAAFEANTAKEKATLDSKEAKIKNQLQFEKDKEVKCRKTAKDKELLLEQDKARQDQLQVQVDQVQAALDELSRAMDRAREDVQSADTQCEKAQADMNALRKRAAGLGAELVKLARAEAAADSAIKAAEAQAAELVAAADVEGHPVPRVAGAAALQEVAEAMDVDEQPGQQAGTSSQQTGVLDSVDYSSLPSKMRQELGKKEQDSTTRSLQHKMSELKGEIESMNPNLKAVEQYDQVKEKEKELAAALDEARKEAAEVQGSYNRCRQSRYDHFTTAFTHISQEIDVIYKELTRSSVHPLGGNAYLSLEQSEEPYLGGIKYTATPPTKRFRDMEQLSGGEKTVAALALLFAIHSFRPSPFFVLDEVDAALDATNVARVAHYIRDKTRGCLADEVDQAASRFQSIVISLKDIFYEKADALVGVARDVDLGCSRTFTFDLSAFGEPLPADR